MAFQETVDGAMIRLNWNDSFQGNWSNTLWCSKSFFTSTDQGDLADELVSRLNNTLLDPLASSVTLTNVIVVDGRTEGAPQVIRPSGATGNTGGDSVPLNLAVCITLRTPLRGRSYRGRVYIAGWTEGDMAGNGWSPATVNSALDIVSAVIDGAAQVGWQLGVRSGQLNNVLRAQAVVTPVINHLSRSGVVTTQRRRVRRG